MIELYKDLADLKVAEEIINLEIQSLNSQVIEEQQKNLQLKSLLKAQNEFISTLQLSGEDLKAQLIFQAAEIKELQSKLEKYKKFKAAVIEELLNLRNTITNQNCEITSLNQVLADKNVKLEKFKEKN